VGELVIRQVGAADAAAIYDICLRTADAGADASTLHRDPSLPGHVWAGAYPVLEPDHAFVLVAGDPSMRVVGYVLGAPDTAVFEQRLERDWWPPLRERYPRDGAGTAADQAMIRLIHEPPRADPAILERFPSHLHVDLLPVAQGRGDGRRMIDAVLTSLAGAGSTGVHVGVDIRNVRAIGFYDAVGFTELARDDGGVVMGRTL